jgi:hypothetical protein
LVGGRPAGPLSTRKPRNRHLVEIKREVYTELELRNRVTSLESETKALGTKVWMLATLFSVFGIVFGIVIGYVIKAALG